MKKRICSVCLTVFLIIMVFCMPAISVFASDSAPKTLTLDLEDGEYSVETELEGGSGKASVTSPALMTFKDGHPYVRLQWSSSNYDYMIVNGEKYLPVNEDGGNSVFEIPILAMDEGMPVIADTTAMGGCSQRNPIYTDLLFRIHRFQESDAPGSSQACGCRCACDHYRRRNPELFCEQTESLLNRFDQNA